MDNDRGAAGDLRRRGDRVGPASLVRDNERLSFIDPGKQYLSASLVIVLQGRLGCPGRRSPASSGPGQALLDAIGETGPVESDGSRPPGFEELELLVGD